MSKQKFFTSAHFTHAMDQKDKIVKMGRGIFSMLAIGTLPILFMNPLQYISALIICGGISFGLAFVLV